MSLSFVPVSWPVMSRTMKWPWLLLQMVALAVLGDADEAGVRLDIALMHGLGLEAALDDDLGRGEAGFDVAQLVLELAGDVGCRRRTRLGADAAHVLVQDGRARLHAPRRRR